MHEWTIDGFARRTAAELDRRSVIGVLGGAVATTALVTRTATAKKKKKCKNLNKKCRSETVDFCAGAPSPEVEEECKTALFRCCSNTALKCKKFSQFLTCCENAGFPC